MRAITVEEIHLIVKQFGDAAYHAKRAGFDGVQIHAVHEGYLLDQFAISMFNHREDEYGGSLENRLRFAKEVVEEIKKRCGEDFPGYAAFQRKKHDQRLESRRIAGRSVYGKRTRCRRRPGSG